MRKEGKPIVYEGKEIPLALHITMAKLSSGKNIRYKELFERLHQTIKEGKN